MRGKRQKRLKRKYKRRIKKMRKVKCDARFCGGNYAGRSGGLLTRKITICYEQEALAGFCRIFQLFAHEAGHMANIPWNRGKRHKSSNSKDNIYNIDKEAMKWCKNNCHEH